MPKRVHNPSFVRLYDFDFDDNHNTCYRLAVLYLQLTTFAKTKLQHQEMDINRNGILQKKDLNIVLQYYTIYIYYTKR